MVRQKVSNANNKPKFSQTKETRKEKEVVKPLRSERGRLSRMIRLLFKYTFYLGVIAFLASTVAILLNCADGAKTIKGSKPLCADLTKLSEFKRPSPLFLTNARNTYGTVVHGYWGRVQPSIHALQKKWNGYYREFVKSDIGIAFDRYYHKVHGFIVDSSLKTVRFLEAKRREIEKWWEKDGRARFGSFVDTLKVTAGVVYEIAKDIVQIAIEALGAFYHRVEVFVHNWSHHGLGKAIEIGF